MRDRTFIKKIPWFLAVLGLCLPLIYQVAEFRWVRGLKGYQATPDTADFSWRNLKNTSYQDYREGQLKYDLRFKPFYIRLNNEIKFDLYGQFKLPDIVEGKEGWLYNPMSIEALYGGEHIDTALVESLASKLAGSIDSLKKRGTGFLFVIEPSKAAIMPEYLPDMERPWTDTLPSYHLWKSMLEKYEIPHMDTYAMFQSWKDTRDINLFTKGGYHWSQASAYRVWDSLYQRIENITGKDLPDYSYSKPISSRRPNKIDRDLADAANLFWSSLVEEEYVYPQLKLNDGHKGEKPKVLLLGDSFYWNFHVDHLDNKFFDKDFIFWYYYDQPYVPGPTRYYKRKEPLSLEKALEGRDIVIYMIFLNNIRYCCWDFVEDLSELVSQTTEQSHE